jgi:cyclin H
LQLTSIIQPESTQKKTAAAMIEDDIYRASSQYRLWSYTEASLQSLRATTNAVASERVRAALRRARETNPSAASSATGTPQPGSDVDGKSNEEKQIECLTPEEELVLVRYYCEKTLELGETYKPPLPTMVRVRVKIMRSVLLHERTSQS